MLCEATFDGDLERLASLIAAKADLEQQGESERWNGDKYSGSQLDLRVCLT